jgi:hypothetical protein
VPEAGTELGGNTLHSKIEAHILSANSLGAASLASKPLPEAEDSGIAKSLAQERAGLEAWVAGQANAAEHLEFQQRMAAMLAASRDILDIARTTSMAVKQARADLELDRAALAAERATFAQEKLRWQRGASEAARASNDGATQVQAPSSAKVKSTGLTQTLGQL